MTFYLQYYQKNRRGVFYENTPLIEIKGYKIIERILLKNLN
jgi:hypothetical protein